MPLVGGFGCLELVLDGSELVKQHYDLNQSEHSVSMISTNESAPLWSQDIIQLQKFNTDIRDQQRAIFQHWLLIDPNNDQILYTIYYYISLNIIYYIICIISPLDFLAVCWLWFWLNSSPLTGLLPVTLPELITTIGPSIVLSWI